MTRASGQASVNHWEAPAFAHLLSAVLHEQEPLYVVGGAVRDSLLARTSGVTDLDLALTGPVLPLARRVADHLGWAYCPLDAERDVARLVLLREAAPPLVCDLAALRGDLATDLALRDFTVNALALELRKNAQPRLIDLCGGSDDLRERRIRVVGKNSLAADPIRLLRAVRFAGQLGFALEKETEAQVARQTGLVTEASAERQRDELWKILALPHPGDRLADLHRLGLLVHVLPEAAALDQVQQSPPHHLDVFGHTVQVMNYAAALRDWLGGNEAALPEGELAELLTPRGDFLRRHFAEELSSGRSRAEWLVWHALFHDTGKPAAYSEEYDPDGKRRIRFFGHEEISARLAQERVLALRFSRRESQVAQVVAASHMRPHHLSESFPNGAISRRACYRFFRHTASGGGNDHTGLDVLLLALADRQAPGKARGGGWRTYLTGVARLLDFSRSARETPQTSLVDGNVLLRAFDLAPGRIVGVLLESIAEAQAAGEINSESEALALAAELLKGET